MIRTQRPAAALCHVIRYYAHLEVRSSEETLIFPVPARTAPVIEFLLGDRFEVRLGSALSSETAHPVAIVGPQTHRRVHLAFRGHVENFTVVFQPGGLSRVLGVPADRFTNQHLEGHAVLGAWGDSLRCRLGEVAAFADRVRVADEYLTRFEGVSHPLSGVMAAASVLLRHRGCLRICGLANMTGLSVRQFERRFTSEIGVSPKLYARVARFEAALKNKARRPQLSWATVAQDVGYHDQMHMVHDFRKLAGASPSDFTPESNLITVGEIGARISNG